MFHGKFTNTWSVGSDRYISTAECSVVREEELRLDSFFNLFGEFSSLAQSSLLEIIGRESLSFCS